jgi:hypothetical protein
VWLYSDGTSDGSVIFWFNRAGHVANVCSHSLHPQVLVREEAMQITRTSMFTGVEHTLDLPVTQAQLDNYYKGGALLQNAFPHLDAGHREFIKTGVTPEEWNETLGPEEE